MAAAPPARGMTVYQNVVQKGVGGGAAIACGVIVK
jgi:hypothetical protein